MSNVDREPAGETLAYEPNAVLLLCGLPGAGKSYFLDRLEVPAQLIPSADEYRERYTGDRRSETWNDEIWFGTWRELGMRARAGQPSIVDATNLLAADRVKGTAVSFDTGAPVHLLAIDTPPHVCLARVRQREGLEPEDDSDWLPNDRFEQLVRLMEDTKERIHDGRLLLDEHFAGARILSPDEADQVGHIYFR